MRRRPGPPPPPVPIELTRFRPIEWWAPDTDPPPPAWFRYRTPEQRFEYHAARAASRWSTARRAAGLRR